MWEDILACVIVWERLGWDGMDKRTWTDRHRNGPRIARIGADRWDRQAAALFQESAGFPAALGIFRCPFSSRGDGFFGRMTSDPD